MSRRFGTGRKKHIFFAFLLFIVLAVIAAIGTGDVGVSQHKIEQDARQKQKIDENWLVAKDISDELGAMLFYDETSGSHVFSVYLKRGGTFLGVLFPRWRNVGFCQHRNSGVFLWGTGDGAAVYEPRED